MDSLSGRARLLVIAAFVLSAALFGTAAVAYVLASRDDDQNAGPAVHPSVIIPTQEPTGSPTPSTSPTPAPKPTLSATPSPTAAAATSSPSASPRPRVTSTSPKPSPTRTVAKEGLAAEAHTDGAQANQALVVQVHATDGDGVIYLRSVNWGDGTSSTLNQRGKACAPAAKAPADCRDYTVSHTFTKPGPRVITLTLVSGDETQVLKLPVTIAGGPPSPTPRPTS